MGIGSVTFSLPHFLTTAYSETYNNDGSNSSTENICSSGNFGNRGEGKNSALLKSFASRIDNFGSSSEGELLQKLPGLEKIKSLTEGKYNIFFRQLSWIQTFSMSKLIVKFNFFFD